MKKNNKGNKRNQSRRPQRNMRSSNDRRYDKDSEAKESPTNDVSWYEQTPDLLRDAANLPFSNAAGVPFNRDVYFENVIRDTTEPLAIPGICVLTVIPAIGDNGQLNSPVNIASNALYSYVRHANSGSKNYDAPNLMMYCMAVAQVYSYINFLQRVYGTSQLYSHYNRYMPRTLLQAQSVDYDSVMNNLAQFRYGINMLIHKASSFACPANLTYFKRLAFLFSGLYAEGESIKDQLYMYVPEGFLTLVEADTTPGWALKYSYLYRGGSAANGYLTVNDLINYGQNLINPLIMSEDINIMSGDILKAYGAEGILGLQTMPEDYTVLPVTDLTVLEQFQNADFIGGDLFTSGYTFVKEDPNQNLLKCNAALSTSGGVESGISQLVAHLNTHVLTTILTNPNPGDVIERTRMMFTCDTAYDDTTKTYTCNFLTGSEFAQRCFLWTYAAGAPAFVQVPQSVLITTSPTPSDVVQWLNTHCMLENFKFHPAVHYFNGEAAPAVWFNVAVDYDNFTTISNQTLTRMNEAALLSLFRVPSVARFN